MKERISPVPFLVALLLSGILFLSGCGGPSEEVSSEEPEESGAIEPTGDELPDSAVAVFERETEREGDSAPLVEDGRDNEAFIDSLMLDENGREREFTDIAMDPRLSELMSQIGEPSEAVGLRLQSAMQLIAAATSPDSEFAKTGLGDPEVQIGTQDPQLVRRMIRSALEEDADGFYGAFAEAMEESGLELAIDPEADTSIEIIDQAPQ